LPELRVFWELSFFKPRDKAEVLESYSYLQPEQLALKSMTYSPDFGMWDFMYVCCQGGLF